QRNGYPGALSWDTNGSGPPPASMLPAASWAGTSGNATSTNLMVVGSPPSFATASMMVTSPAAPRLLTDTLRPARSFGRVMPDALTATTALMSSPVAWDDA